MNWDGVTERRKFRRAQIRLRLEFQGRNGAERSPVEMQTLNLGAGGFYCRVGREIPSLTRLALRFVFPAFGPVHTEARAVECEAIVVRCEPETHGAAWRLAACFSRMESADQRYIDEYVQWYREVFEASTPDDEEAAA